MIQAIITLVCDGDTLGDVRAFSSNATLYGMENSTPLLDGAHAHINAAAETLLGTTLESVAKFVAATADLPADTPVEHGSDICVDLTVRRVSDISCGSHLGEMPTNILVETHPLCGTCD